MTFTKILREIIRDYVTDGVPSSGANKVSKADFRQWGDEIETLASALGLISPQGPWSAVITYQLGDYVSYNGYLFVTKIANNLNNIPDSTTPGDTASWMFLGPALRFELSITLTGTAPTDGEIIEGHVFADRMTFPAGLTGSKATARNTATSSAAFGIRKNAVQIATVTFGAGSPTGVFAMASNQSFVIGDQLDIWCPSPADVTLSGIKITLRGLP